MCKVMRSNNVLPFLEIGGLNFLKCSFCLVLHYSGVGGLSASPVFLYSLFLLIDILRSAYQNHLTRGIES